MEKTKQIILYHIKKYPHIQLQDLVKLLYQGEFAGGHMIENSQKSMELLEQEMKHVVYNSKVDLCEEISAKVCRVNLKAFTNTKEKLKVLNTLFVESANNIKPNKQLFLNKLTFLNRLSKNFEIPFSIEETKSFLKEYLNKGINAIHHSKIYRENYSPAYRVMLSEKLSKEVLEFINFV